MRRVGTRGREMPRRRNSDTNFSDTGTSNISSDLKQRTNNSRDGSWSFSNRRGQTALKCCCRAMWNASEKNTILLLFLDSLFPKKKNRDKCEMLPLETKQIGDKLHLTRRILLLSANWTWSFRENLVNCYIWSTAYMVVKLGHFEK